MKAKIKATGQIVDVGYVARNLYGNLDSTTKLYTGDELDFNPDHQQPQETISGLTDQEIHQLAKEIAQSIATEVGTPIAFVQETQEIKFIPKVLKALLQTHCIAIREKVKALEANIHSNIMYAHDEDDWQEAAHYILDVMPRRFVAVFGTELFEERSKK